MPAQDIRIDQLNQTFDVLFDRILIEDFQLSVGDHAAHYIPEAERASQDLVPALNSLIASNIASFPLSSTVAGITFDFSTGAPVRVVESLGPIFAETAQTLGDRKITIGFNATYLNMNRFRTMDLENMEFAFLHQDTGEPGLGTASSELDVVRTRLGLKASANIFAFSATYGVAPNLDVGIAVPFVSVDLEGTARSTIDSYTLPAIGAALHFFGGDRLNPVLTEEVSYAGSAKGIGDIALRFKYRLPVRTATNLAALVDLRLPTGDQNDFLGTGSLSTRLLLIGSHRLGAFTPHVNIGYDYRGADYDSDEVEFAVGFDQQISNVFTFAIDLLGELDLSSGEAIRLLPGSETISYTNPTTGAVSVRNIDRSNVPDWGHDHTLRAAIGFRGAPTERLQFFANALVSLLDSGLYSNVVPTVGFAVLL